MQQDAGSRRRDSTELFQQRHQVAQEHVCWESLTRVGVLGAGSFGFVTLEEDKASGRRFAMKAISRGYCVQQGLQAATLREKKIHMMLSSPFIVRLFATHRDAQFLYFLLQPALGGDLFEACQDHEDWFGSERHAHFFTAGLAMALEHMHSKKIVYRDLKLENILIDATGYPLVADMGLAKIVFGKTYTVCGTADYMAPETLRRTGHNRAVDWWALGIFVFIMMSGRSPFDADDAAQIYRNIVKGLKKEHYPESFTKHLKDLICNLCKKKPEERLPMGSRGFASLQDAPWFHGFKWHAMATRTLEAPWIPTEKMAHEFANHQVEKPPVVDLEEDQNGDDWDEEF